ncbi:MAG: hypothetical protein IPG04_14730 [Polyangiaceae bacterium]|jgi:hypothetical protein|nr:hypothetical protein [Polyangiaceae bacterium]
MTTDLRVITWVLMPLPLVFVGAAVMAPAPMRPLFVGVSALIVLIYASIWFWSRPTWLEVEGGRFQIIWPLRTRSLGLDEVERAEIVSAGELRDRYGLGMRIGAGGLWGGFGLLAFRSVTFAMYVSRSDRFVLVWLRGQRPLMVTPDDPEAFVAALGRGR